MRWDLAKRTQFCLMKSTAMPQFGASTTSLLMMVLFQDDEDNSPGGRGGRVIDEHGGGLGVRLRRDLLPLREAQIVIESRRRHYNSIPLHASLGYKPLASEVLMPAVIAWLA